MTLHHHSRDIELEALAAVDAAGKTGLLYELKGCLVGGHLPATWLYLVSQGLVFGFNNRLRLTQLGKQALAKHYNGRVVYRTAGVSK